MRKLLKHSLPIGGESILSICLTAWRWRGNWIGTAGQKESRGVYINEGETHESVILETGAQGRMRSRHWEESVKKAWCCVINCLPTPSHAPWPASINCELFYCHTRMSREVCVCTRVDRVSFGGGENFLNKVQGTKILSRHIFTIRINLPLFSTVLPSNSCCFCPVSL